MTQQSDNDTTNITRRKLLKSSAHTAGALSLTSLKPHQLLADDNGVVLNDMQSQLNQTRVHQVVAPTSADDLVIAIRTAKMAGRAISVAGGRHSMGTQQFGTDNLHLDTTSFDHVYELDRERGLVTVDAGIQWPALIEALHSMQPDDPQPWTIREKQTGVDAVSIGGALSSNIHGRALTNPPFVHDIESFELINAAGKVQHCSRTENSELFSLAIGGYGLFGLVSQVTLRLVRQFKIRRKVEIIEVQDLLDWYSKRVAAGFRFGDCQYSPAMSGRAAEHRGVFACYEPVDIQTPVTNSPIELSAEKWARLYKLMRTNKEQGFQEYVDHYNNTEGQVYWSDTHQLAGNFTGHREAVDAKSGTEMITEVYLNHDRLMPFFTKIREDLVASNADITYGTIRFIEPDEETFLPWAREQAACIVCNLHVQHTDAGIAKAKSNFQMIIDRTIQFDGSFFLTYHRWATRDQVAACYPQIRDFFRLKRKYDPEQRFQSDWYRHYSPQFA